MTWNYLEQNKFECAFALLHQLKHFILGSYQVPFCRQSLSKTVQAPSAILIFSDRFDQQGKQENVLHWSTKNLLV